MNRSARIRITITAVFLLIFISSAVADNKTDAVDKIFSQWDKKDTPGCALAVVKDGKIIYERGYGLANLELNIPITPQSVFYVGSLSKQFVAMCIALLAKQGKLSLDDDIRQYVSELPDYGNTITIRHLIHHTSGLRDYLTLLGIAGRDIGTYHEEDVVELLARQKELNFKPGEEYLYSNSGYLLLAVTVERASAESLREFAEENIFKPLGMKNSHFHDDYRALIKNRASGYFPAEEGKYRNFISTFDCVGSGGLFTSVEDLFLWDQSFYDCKVGGKDLIDLMHTRGKLNSGQELDYAFALSIGKYKGLKTVGHGGALGGYRSAFVRFPEQNFSVICLSNLSSFNPSRLVLQVADIYLADQFTEDKATPEAKPADRAKFITLPKKMLQEKAGAYINPKDGSLIRLALRGKTLILEASGQMYILAAVSETEFEVLKAPVAIVIKLEKQKKDKPMLMSIYREGEKSETYESFDLVNPIQEQLKEYTGDYDSDELQVTFKLALKEGKLHFIHKNAPEGPLQPTLKDRFTVRGYRINFIRDEKKKLSGFTLDAGRVKNLRFDKK
jgi:CubicO group peptidase (beta-lactamase class C family)